MYGFHKACPPLPTFWDMRASVHDRRGRRACATNQTKGLGVICSQRIRPSCLPRGTVTVGLAKTLIENFRKFENVKYYLEL